MEKLDSAIAKRIKKPRTRNTAERQMNALCRFLGFLTRAKLNDYGQIWQGRLLFQAKDYKFSSCSLGREAIFSCFNELLKIFGDLVFIDDGKLLLSLKGQVVSNLLNALNSSLTDNWVVILEAIVKDDGFQALFIKELLIFKHLSVQDDVLENCLLKARSKARKRERLPYQRPRTRKSTEKPFS